MKIGLQFRPTLSPPTSVNSRIKATLWAPPALNWRTTLGGASTFPDLVFGLHRRPNLASAALSCHHVSQESLRNIHAHKDAAQDLYLKSWGVFWLSLWVGVSDVEVGDVEVGDVDVDFGEPGRCLKFAFGVDGTFAVFAFRESSKECMQAFKYFGEAFADKKLWARL